MYKLYNNSSTNNDAFGIIEKEKSEDEKK